MKYYIILKGYNEISGIKITGYGYKSVKFIILKGYSLFSFREGSYRICVRIIKYTKVNFKWSNPLIYSNGMTTAGETHRQTHEISRSR